MGRKETRGGETINKGKGHKGQREGTGDKRKKRSCTSTTEACKLF